MLGAIIGDIVGSIYERHNIKSKDFEFWNEQGRYTDDSVMTIAVADAFLVSRNENRDFKKRLIERMQEWGRRHSSAGYGGNFYFWIWSDNPQPYHSFGNGSAMRVSPCGFIASTLEEALNLAKESAEVTHNHPESIKGAQAVAALIFLAKEGKSKEEIHEYATSHFYALDKSLGEIRPKYGFDVSCQGSVPEAIQAFLESVDFEDAIRNAISIGGDSDTIAAITGGIAEAYYGIPNDIKEKALTYLGEGMKNVISAFQNITK